MPDYYHGQGSYTPPSLAQPSGGVVPTAYTLGPISAGANSPLGGFLGWINGLSSSYATGLQVATASPGTAGALIAGQPVDPAVVQAAVNANVNPSGSPFVGAGQTIGALLGTGVNAIGVTTGVAGHGAAPGVATGAQAGAQGVAQVGSAGVTGAFGGTIAGLGLGTAQGISGFSPELLFVALVVLVVILASV